MKRTFGGNVSISFENESGRFRDALQAIRWCCPEGTSVTLVFEGTFSGKLRFSGNKKQSLTLLRNVMKKQGEFGIRTFGNTQSSLEDVFMNVIREVETDA